MIDQPISRAAVPKRPLRVASAIIFVALVMFGVSSSACQLFQTTTPDATPAVSTPVVPVSPPQQMVICIDRSTSYRFTRTALDAVAAFVPELVRPGGGWTIHVRWIAENSFLPEAQISTVAIPAITSAPIAAATPTPVSNPFARREKSLQDKQQEQAQVDYYLDIVGYQDEIARVRAQVQDQADRLKGLIWQPALASDLWGCVERGAELMPSPEGRWLLIASDLEEYGEQQKAAPDLTGARVHIVFFQVDEAPKAVELQTAWRQWLGEAGAAEVQFHDPVEGLGPVLRQIGGP